MTNHIKNLTIEETLAAMKRAGIIDEDGDLTKTYTEVPEGWVSRADPSVYIDKHNKKNNTIT
jgi:hypothetical protein